MGTEIETHWSLLGGEKGGRWNLPPDRLQWIEDVLILCEVFINNLTKQRAQDGIENDIAGVEEGHDSAEGGNIFVS